MLTHLHIWNFAIVEKLDLEFENGLTVLTGETGAGKSILLDALGLALGDRAETHVIRHGSEKAEISVTFDTRHNSKAENWLLERDLNSEQECIIRRTISANGPSKAFINGKPSPIQSLRELGEMLVDLHGQHEHQSLLRRNEQRELLDEVAGHSPLLARLKQAYNNWKALQEELQSTRQAKTDREAHLDLLRYQVKELETLDLTTEELDTLDGEHRRLANASRLLEGGTRIMQLLEEDEQASVNTRLGQCEAELQTLAKLDNQLSSTTELLNNAAIQIKEAASELRHYLDTMEIDPQRLQWIEQRLADIQDLSRKHHITIEELPALLPKLQQELTALEEADIRMGRLQEDIDQAADTYRQLAKKLTAGRKKAAKRLSAQITESMQHLGMQGGYFAIDLDPHGEERFSPHGQEQVDFLVSANPGQPAKPLTKVASGGELSRISLAIQVIAAQDSWIPTLIFDEVDVGIGGRVAEIVGHQLRTLAEQRQVICVTHLPQVAALGHQHLQVHKTSKTNTTFSQIQRLDEQQRIDEIARMLGGLEITDKTLSHAKEMIDRAQENNILEAVD